MTPKKATQKTAPKETAAKKAAVVKVMKPKVTKVTKKKSPVKAMKNAAAGGKKVIAAKGKRRPRMAEQPLPSPIGYADPVDLDEAFKNGVYRTNRGWFDLRTMAFLDDNEFGGVVKDRERGTDIYLYH